MPVEMDEIMEDILLKLLIYKVENGEKWVDTEILKLKLKHHENEIEECITSLENNGLIERNEESIRITREGIDFIVQRV